MGMFEGIIRLSTIYHNQAFFTNIIAGGFLIIGYYGIIMLINIMIIFLIYER